MPEIEEVVASEAKAAEEAVVAEAKEVVAEVVSAVKAAKIEITAEEKLILRDIEIGFLKANMEIQRLQKQVEAAQKNFPAYIDQLTKKYAVSTEEYTFDGVALVFNKK
jgi:hypothetical protein